MIGFQTFHCAGDSGSQPLHCHEEVEFVAVYRGQGVFQCGRSRHNTGSGLLSVVCPQEAHAGTPITADFAVKVLNISSEWFEAVQMDWKSLWCKEAVCEGSSALFMFMKAYETIQQNHSRLSQEEALLALCRAANGRQDSLVAYESERVSQAVMLLWEHFADDLSLTELAATVGLTPSYFCRAFKKTVGLSPHAYQNSLRVARAKTLLEKGRSAGDVAAEVGFYDQSHLIMHFKRLLGISPMTAMRRAISSYTPPSEKV